MATPRHHYWGWGGYHYRYDYDCRDVEDWVLNPRCCSDYGDQDFNDAESCREHFDRVDIKGFIIWEWIMGVLFIGSIALTFILCCCWRRGNKLLDIFQNKIT